MKKNESKKIRLEAKKQERSTQCRDGSWCKYRFHGFSPWL